MSNCPIVKRLFFSLLVLTSSLGLYATSGAYLFVYFPSNSDENIYYALSDNGFDYTPLNNGQRILAADSVSLKHGLRDPHILRCEDGTFLMVATDMKCAEGWESNRGMVLLKSKDLVHWEHSTVHFPDKYKNTNFANVIRVWAPEVIYDPEAGKYMVYYSLLTKDGTIPYDKVYYNYANDDFTDLEGEPTLLFDRGASTIDMDIVHDGTKYHAFYKNENDGGISKVTATHLTAPAGEESSQWSTPSGKLQQTDVQVEGAGVFQLIDGETWVLMYDCYTSGYYQFCTSTDLESFTFKQNTYTSGAFTPRHGTVIYITDQELARLQEGLNGNRAQERIEELTREIATAELLGVDASEAKHLLIDSSHQPSANEVELARQALKVAEFDAVMSTYTDDCTSLLGTWTQANVATSRGQHYNGTSTSPYWEPRNGSNSMTWSMSLRQKVNIPAGEYILKCAGRTSSAAVTATMKAEGKSVRFGAHGNEGRGIDTSGIANYSDEAEYANDGLGRGWDWVYLPISISESHDVNITISALCSEAIRQWASVTSVSLLRIPDEDTGVESNTLSTSNSLLSTYDLQGRQVVNGQQPTAKGIYIRQGKKLIIR